MTASPLFPEALAGADVAQGSVHLLVQQELYPLDAIFAAAFTFINDCWVIVDRADAERLEVVLTPKAGGQSADDLQRWIGGFANELLSCAYRHRLARENRATVEAVTLEVYRYAHKLKAIEMEWAMGVQNQVSRSVGAVMRCSSGVSGCSRRPATVRHSAT